MLIPLDSSVKNIHDLPHTISYVIRKRAQIDGLSELTKEKRPPDNILWHSNPDLLDNWLDEVLSTPDSKKRTHSDRLEIDIDNVE